MYKYQMDKEQAINHIKRDVFPDISDKDVNDLVYKYYYKNWPWAEIIKLGEIIQRYSRWQKSPDKHYYEVTTMRGYKKIVYMCKEQVIHTYARFGIIRDLETKTTFGHITIGPSNRKLLQLRQSVRALLDVSRNHQVQMMLPEDVRADHQDIVDLVFDRIGGSNR